MRDDGRVFASSIAVGVIVVNALSLGDGIEIESWDLDSLDGSVLSVVIDLV